MPPKISPEKNWVLEGNQGPFTAIYDQDYFTGSQCSVYIGDVWVDEITSLSYTTSQPKTPIYGYASQLLDDTAKGQVIVEGNFTINYKEQGYMWGVLQRYKRLERTGNLEAPISPDKEKMELDTRTPTEQANQPAQGHKRVNLGTIERLLSGDLPKNDIHERYLNIAGYATFDADSAEESVFEDIMEVFENQVWGGTPVGRGFDSQIRRTDHNKFDDFDIYVVLGNYQNDMSNHTAQKIQGVRLISQGKQIAVGGAPIQEEYSFIARTIV